MSVRTDRANSSDGSYNLFVDGGDKASTAKNKASSSESRVRSVATDLSLGSHVDVSDDHDISHHSSSDITDDVSGQKISKKWKKATAGEARALADAGKAEKIQLKDEKKELKIKKTIAIAKRVAATVVSLGIFAIVSAVKGPPKFVSKAIDNYKLHKEKIKNNKADSQTRLKIEAELLYGKMGDKQGDKDAYPRLVNHLADSLGLESLSMDQLAVHPAVFRFFEQQAVEKDPHKKHMMEFKLKGVLHKEQMDEIGRERDGLQEDYAKLEEEFKNNRIDESQFRKAAKKLENAWGKLEDKLSKLDDSRKQLWEEKQAYKKGLPKNGSEAQDIPYTRFKKNNLGSLYT